jgi:hypothetical protein
MFLYNVSKYHILTIPTKMLLTFQTNSWKQYLTCNGIYISTANTMNLGHE